MRALALLTIVVASLLLVAGMAVLTMDGPVQATTLTNFSSEDELRSFLQSHGAQLGLNKDTSGYATAEAAAYSDTNVQVAGVDEGDLVKTDGSTIFIAEGSTVHLIGTISGMNNISKITVGNAPESSYAFINALYLYEERLVVLYTVYEYITLNPYPMKDGMVAMYYPYWSTQRTCVLVYDVKDPFEPTTLTTAGISGYLVTSRMIGPVLYVVTDQSVWAGEEIVLPEVDANGTKKEIAATSIGYDPSCPEASLFVNLLSFDVVSAESRSLCTLAGPASVVYMSESALYITMQCWDSANQWWPGRSSGAVTQIYRIAVEGTALTLAAQGSVEGNLLNQFALDESRGRLRVATTSLSSTTSSAVHVLDLDLNEVGSLTGIAPGESIYSSRYLDDRLYLVTFRQVDPLFVIDLSADIPSVLGQLKIPGVSTYLQMVDEGLLGIGFENGSVKVTLFNVTDPRNPFEMGNYTEKGAYSYSNAQYDHHAVLYDARSSLLVIPITYYESASEGNWSYFQPTSAAVVLRLDDAGITEVGRVVHDNATVQRSLYIGDVLYTISDTTMKASSLPGLAPLGELVYHEQQPYYGWYEVAEPRMA